LEYWQQLIIICSLVFFAGFVDSIAGGGGIIALPAYLIAGLTPTIARGSTKFSSTIGTAVASWRFCRRGHVNVRAAVAASAGALAGSAIGAQLSILLDRFDERYFYYILIVSLPLLAVFILFNKRIGTDKPDFTLEKGKASIYSALAGLLIGAYDGFFGPGAGTFLIIVFNAVIGLEVLAASGTAKVVNLASNVAAVIVFLRDGSVFISLAIPAAAFSSLGNVLGSRLAFKNGARVIRPAFLVVLALLLTKIIYDSFFGAM
jgi:hypothetical protein